MARVACIFLVFVLAYHRADAVNGDVEEEDLPDFVGSKGLFLERLKGACNKYYDTRVIEALDLSHCRFNCRVHLAVLFGGIRPTLLLTSREPCSNDGRICVRGVCTYAS
ncbi:uncharacterized protein LOC120849383 [Ixodes scapularis]|uniref:uncharacterized protein LOC120849383 n=1 Tax=Ixodes scapularis TaxID=6945 RepID=UPI001C395054|nr:uncharacterized protein LOC120849383 [Ixodes scapularis]